MIAAVDKTHTTMYNQLPRNLCRRASSRWTRRHHETAPDMTDFGSPNPVVGNETSAKTPAARLDCFPACFVSARLQNVTDTLAKIGDIIVSFAEPKVLLATCRAFGSHPELGKSYPKYSSVRERPAPIPEQFSSPFNCPQRNKEYSTVRMIRIQQTLAPPGQGKFPPNVSVRGAPMCGRNAATCNPFLCINRNEILRYTSLGSSDPSNL
jgi:hypothetical protein